MIDNKKTDLVVAKSNLPATGSGGHKILSTVMDDLLKIAREKHNNKTYDDDESETSSAATATVRGDSGRL